MVCHPVTGIADLTLAHLHGVVGRFFRTCDRGGRRVELRLVAVTDMRPRRRIPPEASRSVVERDGVLVAISTLGLGADSIPFGERRIGLLFQGPLHRRLADDRYDLELPWLPLRGLHLTPLESDPDSQEPVVLYEAVID